MFKKNSNVYKLKCPNCHKTTTFNKDKLEKGVKIELRCLNCGANCFVKIEKEEK